MVLDPTCPRVRHSLDFVNINILTKLDQDRVINVASRMVTFLSHLMTNLFLHISLNLYHSLFKVDHSNKFNQN